MQSDLYEMLGNAPERTLLLHPTIGKTQEEISGDKHDKRDEICDLAGEMNVVYKRLMEIYDLQKGHGVDYRNYSVPDSETTIVMEPETARILPLLTPIRTEQLALEKKFNELKVKKSIAVREVQDMNMLLINIETKINETIDRMLTAVKGKRIAIPIRPYQYISNDGRVYFQM